MAPDGRENEPHITVKFGLHSADPQQVANLLKGIGPIRVKFGRISHFPPAPYSRGGAVLKYDIESPDLMAINALISDRLEVTDTYKHYVPHATIAYVQPGFVAKYEGDGALTGKEATIDKIMFAGADGKRYEITLRGKASPPKPWPPRPRKWPLPTTPHPRNRGRGRSSSGAGCRTSPLGVNHASPICEARDRFGWWKWPEICSKMLRSPTTCRLHGDGQCKTFVVSTSMPTRAGRLMSVGRGSSKRPESIISAFTPKPSPPFRNYWKTRSWSRVTPTARVAHTSNRSIGSTLRCEPVMCSIGQN
ncbi:MAG: 2'-5' RNA ligase family protein [Phycisphaeraceae bacterium]|nr:2'-5' RNA ligase family protein [Phycisphaeraceae bacterium]